MDRREFLTQTMGLGVAAVAAQAAGAPMQGFRVAPMDKVRVDASVDWLVKNGYPKPAGYSGEEG